MLQQSNDSCLLGTHKRTVRKQNRAGRLNPAKKGSKKMKIYEIKYTYNGKEYEVVEQPTKGWESQFLQKVINRIESLVNAGAVVTSIVEMTLLV